MAEENKGAHKDINKKSKDSIKARNQDTDLYRSHLPDFLFTPATPECLPPVKNESGREEEESGVRDEE